ncbi:MAG: hypothetical protein PHC70_01280 [Patescibacteria group bacterium]|nr:hypothetical protein [Patescibacteria group bacterium]
MAQKWEDAMDDNLRTLNNGQRVSASLFIGTMVLIYSMADHFLIFREVTAFSKTKNPEAKLSKMAVDFLRIRGVIPLNSNHLDETIREIINLAYDDKEKKIQNPAVYPPWSPSK